MSAPNALRVSDIQLKSSLIQTAAELIMAADLNMVSGFNSEITFKDGRRFNLSLSELPSNERPRDSLVDGLAKLGISAGDVECFDRCGDIVYIDCKDGRSFMFDMTGV